MPVRGCNADEARGELSRGIAVSSCWCHRRGVDEQVGGAHQPVADRAVPGTAGMDRGVGR